MLSKRTIIGFVIGSIIIGIGIAAFVQHLGIITIEESHFVSPGDTTFYTIPAPAGLSQTMTLTGDTFNVTLSSPGDGQQIPETSYKKSQVLEWSHFEDGQTNIKIENTGNIDLEITGVIQRSSDPIWFTFDLMVIISGIVIIGFSMGFTLRRPKGF